jgi:hypothetical protein
MRGNPCKQRSRTQSTEMAGCEPPRWLYCRITESQKLKCMPRQVWRGQDVGIQTVPAIGQPAKRCPVRVPVVAQARSRFIKRPVQQNRAAIVERVRQGDRWLDPFQPMLVQRQCAKKRRANR